MAGRHNKRKETEMKKTMIKYWVKAIEAGPKVGDLMDIDPKSSLMMVVEKVVSTQKVEAVSFPTYILEAEVSTTTRGMKRKKPDLFKLFDYEPDGFFEQIAGV